MKKKLELSHTLIEVKHRAEVELQMYGIKITNIRLDRAGENFPNTIEESCSKNVIHLEPSHGYAPQGSDCSETLIQEHLTRARVLLFSSTYPKYLWPKAIHDTNRLRNLLPASRIDNRIPIMRWKSNARIGKESLLEFGSSRFASISYIFIGLISRKVPRKYEVNKNENGSPNGMLED